MADQPPPYDAANAAPYAALPQENYHAPPGNAAVDPYAATSVPYAQSAENTMYMDQTNHKYGPVVYYEGVDDPNATCCYEMNCCSDAPLPPRLDPYGMYPNQFQTTLCDVPCNEPAWCCLGLWCPYCALCYTRYRVVGRDMTQYRCCQGVFDNNCCHSGQCCESYCPHICNCCEAAWCPCMSISASRIAMMDSRQFHSDPSDRRLIRFNNCCQLFTCIFYVLGFCIRGCRSLYRLSRCASQCVYCSIQACMVGQILHELDCEDAYALQQQQQYAPPAAQKMGA